MVLMIPALYNSHSGWALKFYVPGEVDNELGVGGGAFGPHLDYDVKLGRWA